MTANIILFILKENVELLGEVELNDFKSDVTRIYCKKVLKNGDSYEGFFENGQKTGFGKYVWAKTGDIYEGEWLSDIIQGKGKYEWKKTGNVYEGDIVDGKRTGYGKLVWNTRSSKRNEYVGQWLNGKMTGKGIFSNTKIKFFLSKILSNKNIKGNIFMLPKAIATRARGWKT
jgi:hypothetical protein